MLNFELICDFKSKTIACKAKVQECDFPVTSVTKIDVTNLFDLNTIPRKSQGDDIQPVLYKDYQLITCQRKYSKKGTTGEHLWDRQS